MIEVEIKARINDLENIKKKLEHNAKLKRQYNKNDVYFKKEDFIVRIREDQQYVVTFKTKKIEDCMEVSEENEFVIENENVFIKMLQVIGFKEYFRKVKTGAEYHTDSLNLDLSLVNNLGWFLEIEKLVEKTEDIGSAKKEIVNMLKKLNLEDDIEVRTYEQLILENKRNVL